MADETVAELAARFVALSQWVNAGSLHRDPEAVLWSRVLKVTEEAGEVYKALSGAIGENPRKGVTHTMDDVVDELLDTASAALCAVEHVTGHAGQSIDLLVAKVARTTERAGLLSLASQPTTADNGLRQRIEALADELNQETAHRRRVAGATPCCDSAERIRRALDGPETGDQQ